MKRTLFICFLSLSLMSFSCEAGAQMQKVEVNFPDTYAKAEKLSPKEIAALPDLIIKVGTPADESTLQGKNLVELRILRNSIFAQYGYEFKVDWIRDYFKSRSWYKPGGFDNNKLTKVDHKNVALVSMYEQMASGVKPSMDRIEELTSMQMKMLPDIKVPSNALLKAKQLNGLSKVELRLLRNSIFAQYGRKFKTDWIQRYFESRNWYTPGDFSEDKLTSTDLKNIKLIQLYEDKQADAGLKTALEMGYCEDESSWESVTRYVFKTDGKLNVSVEAWGPYQASYERTLTGQWRAKSNSVIEYKLNNQDNWKTLTIYPDEHKCG